MATMSLFNDIQKNKIAANLSKMQTFTEIPLKALELKLKLKISVSR